MANNNILIEIWPLLLAGIVCLTAVLLIFVRNRHKDLQAPQIPERTSSALGIQRKNSCLSLMSTASLDKQAHHQSTLIQMMKAI
jgi:hypothetical protein